VDVLVGTIREAGLPVELAVEGRARELAPGVDLAAYRVIQEALTNALKYAGPARAWVTVRWREDEIEVEIANDGSLRGRRRRHGARAGRAARASGARRRHDRVGPAGRRRVRGDRPPAAPGTSVTTKVLIVDDQSLVRAGFRMILESEPEIEVVGEAADGLTAVLAARETEPDVILMDVRMPNVDGLEATRRLLEGRSKARAS
jgi:hypothetical protein